MAATVASKWSPLEMLSDAQDVTKIFFFTQLAWVIKLL